MHHKWSKPSEERFFERVNVCGENECWEWQGCVDRRGYGKFMSDRKHWRAHRFSYFLHYGVDPGEYFVLHSCDNPVCVNPHHLSLGTPKENSQDMARKGHWKNHPVERPSRTRSKTGPRAIPPEQRFWQKVDKRGDDECWEWQGYRDRHGYGTIFTGNRANLRMWRAPRYSYYLHNGVDPADKMVLHSCDNPSCVNPKHLRLGTYADNNKESFAKGRNPNPTRRGMDSRQSNLTDDDVREIRRRWKAGESTQTAMAKEYDVAQSAISSIVLYKTWRHI